MTDSTLYNPISKQAWDDLKDRLTILVPRGINLGLQHRHFGCITLGEYPKTNSITELPSFPDVEIVINGATDVINRTTIVSLIEQLLSDVNEAESLSQELVSIYGDLAALEELGNGLPSCNTIADIAAHTGNVISQKIAAMGCCVTVDDRGDWESAGVWGGAIRCDLSDKQALQQCLDNRRPLVIDSGPLPNVLAADAESGSWCAIPMINDQRAEGLIILARHDGDAFTSKDAKLIDIIARQVATYILKIRQEENLRHAEVLAHEVSLAGGIQQSLLPKAPPPIEGYSISGRLSTAEKVGGDYFDHIFDGRYVTLVVADVSGHSVPAALAMTMVRTALRAGNDVHPGPAALLTSMNQHLCDDLAEAGLFVSLLITRIDTTTGFYQVGCAGHPPMLHRLSNGRIQAVDAEGMILGFHNEAVYEETEGVLADNESLLLYTDGILESENRQQEMFGQERLETLLSKADMDSDRILNSIEHALFHWSQGRQSDDVTMLSIVRSS